MRAKGKNISGRTLREQNRQDSKRQCYQREGRCGNEKGMARLTRVGVNRNQNWKEVRQANRPNRYKKRKEKGRVKMEGRGGVNEATA